MPTTTPRRRGFTLVELLTVIAILGLLMGILLPTLGRARDRAKQNVCLSRLRPLASATVIYLNENRDTFFPVRLEKLNVTDELPYANAYGAASPRWQWFLETDLGPVIDPRPFKLHNQIPFDDDSGPKGSARQMSGEIFLCPTLVDELYAKDIRDGAFGYNYQYLGNTQREKITDRWPNFPVGTHQVRATSATILFADSRGAGPKHGEHSYTLDPPRRATEKNATTWGPDKFNIAANVNPDLYAYSPAEARHNGLANVVFADAHGEAMTLRAMGYDIDPGHARGDVPRNVPVPVISMTDAFHNATNKLWTGLGTDPIADAAAGNTPPSGP